MASNKPGVDWERIENEYRAGQISISQIAECSGITRATIQARARREGWLRNLTEAVRQKVEAKLLSDGDDGTASGTASSTAPNNAREIVEKAAARGADVVRQHRTYLKKTFGIFQKLSDQLEKVLSGDRKGVHCFVSNGDGVSTVTRAMVDALKTVIQLERQAFNLDDKEKEKPPALKTVEFVPKITETYHGPTK